MSNSTSKIETYRPKIKLGAEYITACVKSLGGVYNNDH